MGKYTNRQIATLLIIGLADFCSAICVSLQAPFYPAEAEAKGATATQYGLVFGIFELVVFIVSPIYGEYISKIGAKFMFNAGIFITGSTCILFGFLNHVQDTKTFVTLSFLVRIVEALGNAGFLTAAFSIIAKEFSDNVSVTFAALETCFGVGLIVGPTVGGALYELGGYTLPFVCMGSLLLTAAALTFFLLPSADGPSETDSLHGGSQMIELLKIPPVALAAFSIIASSISIGFVQATLEPHLRPLQLSPFQTGLVFVLNGATYAASAPIWGKLCDKGVPPIIISLIGSLTVIVAFILLGPAPFLPIKESLGLCIAALIIHGFGFGAQLVATFGGAHRDAIAYGMPNNLTTYGLVSGMWTSTFALGAFIGPSSAGVLLDAVGFSYASQFIVGLHALVVILIIICSYCCTKPPGKPIYRNLDEEAYTEETQLNRRSWDSTYGSLNSEPSSSRSTSCGDSRESLNAEIIFK
ncbi:hypothetical protein HAZT_HAZT003132 [Hyalella azteca]|nr:hypothetical protein HAZT_HAZT003132 [Hyalella azteca]